MKIYTQKRGYPRLDAKTQKRVARLRDASSKLNGECIAAGLGHVRYSELCDHMDVQCVAEMLKIDSELFNIYAEYERLTGVRASLGIF
jgi:hypothetical protein